MATHSDFKVGQIVEHVTSGKLYLVCDDQMNYRGHLQVIGGRDGLDFGPARFIDVTKLRAVQAGGEAKKVRRTKAERRKKTRNISVIDQNTSYRDEKLAWSDLVSFLTKRY